MRDNWALGYSSRYTVGVWVGNFSGEPMHEVSGVTGAAPVWREIMDFLHEGEAPPAPKAPKGMRRQAITYAEGIEPPREEWFLEGTAVALVARAQLSEGRPRIVSPPDGARLAVDPDIPGARQRVAVVVAGARPGMHLRIDSRILPATRPQLWQPAPGQRIVRLLDEGGNEVDRVQVTVRGVR